MKFSLHCLGLLIFSIAGFIGLIGCGEQNMTTFGWLASESGTKH